MVYSSVTEVDFVLTDLPALPRPERILLTSPEAFDVLYVINPHMEGQIGGVDRQRAREQWEALKEAYERIGFRTEVVQGAPGLPDMVFCANQTLPFLSPEGTPGVVLSRMNAPQRQPEVASYEEWFGARGLDVRALAGSIGSPFEGMGDAIWHPGRRFLWGGYGFRTGREVYEQLSEIVQAPVLAVELTDPDFYHLDTCLSMLDEQSALYYPGAFQPDGLALLECTFPHLIEAPEDEARHLFACNAHCPDGRHVLIQKGCRVTNKRLREAGFEPVELDTSEFLKSGGSVFCMKLAYWG